MSKEVIYPTWRYHKELGSKVISSPEEDKALGKGWADSPIDCPEAPAVPPVQLVHDKPTEDLLVEAQIESPELSEEEVEIKAAAVVASSPDIEKMSLNELMEHLMVKGIPKKKLKGKSKKELIAMLGE